MLTSNNVPLINLGRIFLEQSTRGVAMVRPFPPALGGQTEGGLMQSNHDRLFAAGTA